MASVLDKFDAPNQHRLWPLVREQLPGCLFDRYSARIPERLPWEYQKSMIASGMASRFVYREGLSFVNHLPDARLPTFALAYLQQEHRVRELANQVATSSLVAKDEVKDLLLRGGVRAAAEEACSSSRVAHSAYPFD